MIHFHLEYDYITLTLLNINNFPMMAYVLLSSTQKGERTVFWQLLFLYVVSFWGNNSVCKISI